MSKQYRILIKAILIVFSCAIYFIHTSYNAYARDNSNDANCLSVRAVVIHIRSKGDISFSKELIDSAVKNNFNTIMIENTRWVKYPNLKFVDNKQDIPTPEDMTNLIEYAKLQKTEVIPFLWLLTHQESVAKFYDPTLLLNDYTLDISNPKSWEFEKALIDNTITLYHPKKMLIGHDELWGYTTGTDKNFEVKLKSGMKRLSASDYVNHIIKIHDYLKKQGIQTMIFGDMFLVPEIVGTKQDMIHDSYNGTIEIANLIDKLPKDIIICDWHYNKQTLDYKSYDYFQKKGFLVWGTTWYDPENINNFSNYVRIHARKGEGMIATMWHYGRSKGKQIIKDSGQAFNQGCNSKI